MKNNSVIGTCVWSVVLGLLAGAPLCAATQIQEVWGTYGGNGFFNWSMKEGSAYGDSRRRNDTERGRFFSRTPEKRVEIERIDLDKRWTLDPRKKRYSEESISEANEKNLKEMERNRREWEKSNKNAKREKDEEPTMRIRRAETKVSGPGSVESINGFSCRPYTIKTTVEYESLPARQLIGTQTLYQKQWVSDDPLLAQYQNDQIAYFTSAGPGFLNKQELQELQRAVQSDLAKAEKDASSDPWLSFGIAVSKINGYPVRTLVGFTMSPEDGKPLASASRTGLESKEEGLVEPEDLSGGVGGLVSGIATRWASKKAGEKIRKKMEEQPAWIEEIAKDLDTQNLIGWGWMTEVKSVTSLGSSMELFELPAGYKKVKSL